MARHWTEKKSKRKVILDMIQRFELKKKIDADWYEKWTGSIKTEEYNQTKIRK